MFVFQLAILSSYVTLAALLLISAVAISLTGAALAAWSLLHPPRMTDGKAAWVLKRLSPGDLGLKFVEESYVVMDGPRRPERRLKLAAWWIDAPRPSDQSVVLIHGYADAKVGAIAWAPLFHQLGFNILAIDLRTHGESDGSYCTAGVLERHDLRQMLDQLRARRPSQTNRLVLFGASLGASVAVATAVLAREQPAEIDALILDSPYNDFERAACAHLERLGAGGSLFQWLAIRIANLLARVNFEEMKLAERLPEVVAPVMVIESGEDQIIDAAERRAVAEAIQSRCNPKDLFWHVPEVLHLLAMQKDPIEYRHRLSMFLRGAGFNVPIETEPLEMPAIPSGL